MCIIKKKMQLGTINTSIKTTRSFFGPPDHTVQPKDIFDNALYIALPESGEKIWLTKHAIHHVVVHYGAGKAKIAVIQSTLTRFRTSNLEQTVLIVESMGFRTWMYEYEDKKNLEEILCGKFTEYNTPEAKEEAEKAYEALREKAETYDRKLARQTTRQYHYYGESYLHMVVSSTKYQLACNEGVSLAVRRI